MEQVPEEKKDALTKTFAIVGFTALTIFIVWFAVQLVGVLPSAFSSLASLADSVYNYDSKQELQVGTSNSVVNAGESFTISWTQMKGVGVYSFSYKCIEGVALDVKNTEGAIVSLNCDTQLTLAQSTSLEVLIASEKFRFVDVPYTITFAKDETAESVKSTTKTITVVNASIPASGVVTAPVVTTDPTPVPPTPVVKPVVKPTTTTVPKVIYGVPVSNPNGIINLQTTYLGAGSLSGSTFVPATKIDMDLKGAIRFEVKNIGTKTATNWSYVAQLPSGITYTSPIQKELKPNERAVITLGFDGLTEDGIETLIVVASAAGDSNTKNNALTVKVEIVD